MTAINPIMTMKKENVGKKFTIVGHSIGCLIALLIENDIN